MHDPALLAALGPLAPLYQDEGVTEVLVDRPDRAYTVRNGEYQDLPGLFSSAEQLRAAIDAVFALSGVALVEGRTVGETRLPDGSRFIAVVPPTSGDVPCLVIRRLSRSPLDWDALVAHGILTADARSLLTRLACDHFGILFAGDAGSGKEGLANLFAESIPGDRRVVVVQDVVELPVRHPRAVHLEANLQATRQTVAELLDTAARLDPDWLVVCQLRGAETLRALEVLGSGPAGIAIVHAHDLEDALQRLETQCRMASTALSAHDVRRLITSALRFAVLQERLPEGPRVLQLAELRLSGELIELLPLFRYNPATGTLQTGGLAAMKHLEELLGGADPPSRRPRRDV